MSESNETTEDDLAQQNKAELVERARSAEREVNRLRTTLIYARRQLHKTRPIVVDDIGHVLVLKAIDYALYQEAPE